MFPSWLTLMAYFPCEEATVRVAERGLRVSLSVMVSATVRLPDPDVTSGVHQSVAPLMVQATLDDILISPEAFSAATENVV